MRTKILRNLGLSEAEIKVYITLLELGLSTTGKLIKQTGLQKSTVYYALDNLEKEGFVGISIRNNIKHFKAENPQIISEKIKQMERDSQEVISELKGLQEIKDEKVQSMINEGAKTVSSSFQHRLAVLKKNDELLIFGSLATNPESKSAVLTIQKVNGELIRRGVNARILFNKELKGSTLAKFYRSLPGAQVKYTEINLPTGMAIYKDFTYTFVWKDSRNSTSILTKSKIISDIYKDFFNSLWKQAKK